MKIAKVYQPHTTSTGNISANILALCCCALTLLFGVVGFAVSLVLFFIERNSGLVKYYAMFSSVLWVAKTVLNAIFSMFQGRFSIGAFGVFSFHWGGSILFSLLRLLVALAVIAILVLGAIQAYQWKVWELPLLSNIVFAICNATEPAVYTGDGPVPPGCEPGSVSFGDATGQPPPSSSPYGQPPQYYTNAPPTQPYTQPPSVQPGQEYLHAPTQAPAQTPVPMQPPEQPSVGVPPADEPGYPGH